jgi:hypothetical protein
MDNSAAIELIRSLANGIDPITGEIIPESNSLNDPRIIRAFFLAIQALETKDVHISAKRRKLNNAGKPWSPEEDQQLIEAFDNKKTIAELMKVHERSRGALASRLVHLGKIKVAPEKRVEFNNAGKPWSPEEDQQLIEAFDNKIPPVEMIRLIGRTRDALAARLVRLGKIKDRSEFGYVPNPNSIR